ncbi:p53 and DNA damage-regulated protein 1-like [Anneissia japonica]|uniref:p53 and DNA damage-regulated protein 1-like n=1 Tax=Anneissia japonica TaxID=1529436 RepID=UPI001425B887|nr:p53 and DNA damage-regulated protein 1-like [Anneissia japonica]
MALDTQTVLRHFSELEELAEDILSDKHQVVELDKKRNKNREALRALAKMQPNEKSKKEKNVWVCFGNMFVKMPVTTTQQVLSDDQKQLDKGIEELRNGLKPKVARLRDMEGEKEAKGFDLQCLSKSDLKTVYS